MLFSEDYSQWSVQRLESFRKVYADAFNCDRINTIIRDQCIDALFLVRNVFAHELGVVDDFAKGKFRERNLTQWAELPSGKHFPINGKCVKDYAERNTKQGVLLLMELDKWIATKRVGVSF